MRLLIIYRCQDEAARTYLRVRLHHNLELYSVSPSRGLPACFAGNTTIERKPATRSLLPAAAVRCAAPQPGRCGFRRCPPAVSETARSGCTPVRLLRSSFSSSHLLCKRDSETKSQCVTHSFVTFTSNSVTKQRRVLFPGRLAFVYRVLRRRLPRASPC